MANSKPNYYNILGVDKTATQDEIKKAFRKLARDHHPDAGGDEEKFKEINEAYEVLSDEEKRKVYNQFGTARPGYGDGTDYAGYSSSPFDGTSYHYSVSMDGDGFDGFNWDDILDFMRSSSRSRSSQASSGSFGSSPFNGFDIFDGSGFSNASQASSAPRDTLVTLDITFDEAYSGTKKTISLDVPGRGKQTFDIHIPAGARDGGKLRLRGKGSPSPRGTNEDLLIETHILPHHLYRRDKADVVMELPISIDEALLGASVIVPAPDNTKVRVRIPAGTADGTKMKISNKGAPDVSKKDGKSRGDLRLEIKVVIPTSLNEKQKAALEDFAAATNETVRSW